MAPATDRDPAGNGVAGTGPDDDRSAGVSAPAARAFGLTVLGAAAAGSALLLVRPPVDGAYLVCPWLALTGTDCPFCGGMRCAAALAQGDFAAAADYNLLLAVALPLLLLIAVAAVLLGRRAQPVVDALFAPRAAQVLLGVVAVWFVVRLLPVAAWLTSTG